jgi:hypothetical protein
VQSEVLTLNLEVASAEEYRDFVRDIAPPIRALVADNSPDVQAAFWSAILEAVKGFADPDGSISIPNDTIVVAGSK